MRVYHDICIIYIYIFVRLVRMLGPARIRSISVDAAQLLVNVCRAPLLCSSVLLLYETLQWCILGRLPLQEIISPRSGILNSQSSSLLAIKQEH